MKTASARQANHEFSELLSRVERGEEILITKRNKPMALLSPYRPPLLTPERRVAIDHATDVMAKGLGPGRCRTNVQARGNARAVMSVSIPTSWSMPLWRLLQLIGHQPNLSRPPLCARPEARPYRSCPGGQQRSVQPSLCLNFSSPLRILGMDGRGVQKPLCDAYC